MERLAAWLYQTYYRHITNGRVFKEQLRALRVLLTTYPLTPVDIAQAIDRLITFRREDAEHPKPWDDDRFLLLRAILSEPLDRDVSEVYEVDLIRELKRRCRQDGFPYPTTKTLRTYYRLLGFRTGQNLRRTPKGTQLTLGEAVQRTLIDDLT